ncbi:MAG: helix-turn-helix domain-containing protein [bacterium]|nr:helix-turn-helix domain-containing protein [bacterium]
MEKRNRELEVEIALKGFMTAFLELQSERTCNPSDPDQLLSPKNAALMLGISVSQVRILAQEGLIPHLVLPSIGNGERSQIRFRRSTLLEWVAAHEQRDSR